MTQTITAPETTANGLSEDEFRDWVEALRSGHYEQGMNRLCDGSKFCCLGVLTERSGLDMQREVPGLYGSTIGGLAGTTDFPGTPDVLRKLDLDLRHVLAEANDAGITFAQIADALERNKELVMAGPMTFLVASVQDFFPDLFDEDGYRL